MKCKEGRYEMRIWKKQFCSYCIKQSQNKLVFPYFGSGLHRAFKIESSVEMHFYV